jgi:hypothetical protein
MQIQRVVFAQQAPVGKDEVLSFHNFTAEVAENAKETREKHIFYLCDLCVLCG